ncbi:MAG: hypothetical protein NC247_06770 [Ruminococcus flavefaciens]|nr:hypothetical protein [Ruminococcus flavefaciens]MCM1361473.1 hypothetical protein [Clostridiales bacterium]MCM1434461.1 hypothetical protein [Ruminococcus flavefaciens]
MIKYRIVAFLTAAAMMLSAGSCSLRGYGDDSSKTKTEVSDDKDENDDDDSGIDAQGEYKFSSVKDSDEVAEVREHVEKLLDDLNYDDNEDELKDDIAVLLDDMDIKYEDATKLMITYYLDWNNETLESQYDDAAENMYITVELITYAFCRGYANEQYSHLFKDLILDEEAVETYTEPAFTLKHLEGYTRVNYNLMDANLDEYHDIAYDEDMDEEEKALKCAEIYLELLAQYDTETFYDKFNRDYTPEEILELSKVIREELIPASEALMDAFYENSEARKVARKPTLFDDPFKVIQEYAPRLSTEIAEAADTIVENELYTIADGEECYNGSFTSAMPKSKSSVVYIYNDGDYNNLLTPVHEFGHYYASFYDDIPTYLAASNIDIAETQSQGFEFLFTQFYDEIYEEQADAMKIIKTYDMLYSVISGFFIGEFEYTVLANRENYTPEDVVKLWHDIMDDYIPDTEFYIVNHLFESPGYYISYGVSALAAFDIWEDCIYNTDEALKKYEKIARTSCNEKDNNFHSAIKDAGFSDVLNKEYIKVLAQEIYDYIEDIS